MMGDTIASWHYNNQYSYWTAGYYEHEDWEIFWNYMDDYFSAGADNEVEDVLSNVVFPDPWSP